MSVYTISPCLFRCDVRQWAPIVTNFISDGALKIALDRDGRAMDHYKAAPSKSDEQLVISCLDLISKCNKYELIDIGQASDDDLFLEICAKTVGTHELIVKSRQAYAHLKFIGSNTVDHKGTLVSIYDKDEALARVRTQPSVNIGMVNNSAFSATGDVNFQGKTSQL